MGMMMAVSFTRYGRLYYLDPGPYSPKVGDKVLVPTEAGSEVAECIWAPQYVSEDVELPVCAGIAGEEHLARDEANRRRRAEARSIAKRLIRKHELPMKVIGVDYLDGDNTYKIYFSAPHRVDFRALVRDLATRPGCRAASGRAGATCAAPPSSRTSSRCRSGWPRSRTSPSTRCASPAPAGG
jgi:cell fate regulator YaaT (PSP1 superfamily)